MNENNVILIYTGKSVPKSSNGTGRDDWNREHVWAKSHGDFGTRLGAGTDLHHIKPADVTVNSSRNNKNFDDSDAPHHEAFCAVMIQTPLNQGILSRGMCPE